MTKLFHLFIPINSKTMLTILKPKIVVSSISLPSYSLSTNLIVSLPVCILSPFVLFQSDNKSHHFHFPGPLTVVLKIFSFSYFVFAADDIVYIVTGVIPQEAGCQALP